MLLQLIQRGCIVGQAAYGPLGVVIGLAFAEILAAWSLLPLLARMPVFLGFGRYCLNLGAAAAATLGLCFLDGFILMSVFPSNSRLAITGKIGVWALTAAAPAVALALPAQIRSALLARAKRVVGRPWRRGEIGN